MRRLFAVALVLLPTSSWAEDYFGVLRLPAPASFTPGPYYAFSSLSSNALPTPADTSHRFKLGYKYSRFFAVESELTDYARPSSPFASPTSLSSAFRSTGFSVDTVATLPLWRLSFYGRMGAYRGDRNNFATYTTALLNDPARGTRWRYGLGVRYDFTRSLGMRAEVERYSNSLGSPMAGDVDADQVSVGVSWRF